MLRSRRKTNNLEVREWTSFQHAEGITSRELSDDDITRDIASLIRIQKSLATFALERTITLRSQSSMLGSRLIKDGRTLLRGFHASSYCEYTPEAGITCSDLAHCYPSTSFKQLQDWGELSRDKLHNHCGGASFTQFMSTSDDPVSLRRYIERVWPKKQGALGSGQIALIDMDILSSLGVLFARCDELAAMLKMKPWRSETEPDGLQFTHPAHWIIYGWIPPQAIRKVVGVEEFLTLCNTNNQSVFYKSQENILVDI